MKREIGRKEEEKRNKRRNEQQNNSSLFRETCDKIYSLFSHASEKYMQCQNKYDRSYKNTMKLTGKFLIKET